MKMPLCVWLQSIIVVANIFTTETFPTTYHKLHGRRITLEPLACGFDVRGLNWIPIEGDIADASYCGLAHVHLDFL